MFAPPYFTAAGIVLSVVRFVFSALCCRGLMLQRGCFFAAMLRRGPCFLHPPFALRPPPRFFPFALRPEDVVEREAFVSVDSAVL